MKSFLFPAEEGVFVKIIQNDFEILADVEACSSILRKPTSRPDNNPYPPDSYINEIMIFTLPFIDENGNKCVICPNTNFKPVKGVIAIDIDFEREVEIELHIPREKQVVSAKAYISYKDHTLFPFLESFVLNITGMVTIKVNS